MRKYLLFTLFLCLHWSAWGQAPYEYRYWFDGDEKNQKTGKSGGASWHIDADVSQLSNTLHAVHFQIKDKSSVWSAPTTRYFLKTPDKQLNYRYWMDGDLSTMKSGVCNNQPMMIDVAGLSDGFHVLYAQVGNGDVESSALMRMFIKIPQTEGVKNLKCVCSIDEKIYKQEFVPSSGGLVDWAFDVSSLEQGLHTLHIQVLTNSGAATNVYKGFFLRVVTNKELADMKCVYSIDGGDNVPQKGVYANGAYHFDLDVASLSNGLHSIAYMLASKTGTTTRLMTSFFFKTTVGGPGIASYRYWLNDDLNKAKHVYLKQAVNPYELVSMLPFEKCDIRTSCFHFEVENNVPMVYAKNDFNILFFDTNDRATHVRRPFVDYNVGEEAKIIATLTSKKQTVSTVPKSGEMRWYKFDAEKNDSVVFKTDLKATIDVFDSKGANWLSVSDAKAKVLSGFRIAESGTYYVAVHDAESTLKTHIGLYYENVGKQYVDPGITGPGDPDDEPGGSLGIDGVGNGSFGVSPLVTVDFITVNMEGNMIESIAITDMSGKRVRSYKDVPSGFTVDVSALPEGIYIVSAKSNGKSLFQKITKITK